MNEPDALARNAFERDVLAGLKASVRRLPFKYLYDEAGSELFLRILEQPEYYPARTELQLMRRHGAAMAAALGASVVLIELGSGNAAKTEPLLSALAQPAAYVPVDISGTQLRRVAARIGAAHPQLAVWPVAADFTAPLALPPGLPAGPRVVFFPGCTLFNFEAREAQDLLRSIRALVGTGGRLLLGVDQHKSEAELLAAYDDAAGATAAFNRNVLVRVNRMLGADFVPRRFAHQAHWNAAESRMEMRLVAEEAHDVRVAGHTFRFEPGDSLLTEVAYKLRPEELHRWAERTGWCPESRWENAERAFSVELLTAV